MTMRSVGEVVALLRVDFPDLSVSKLRYWELRGIVTPQRTPGGQRRYSDADVATLRQALRLQRDDFIPLGAMDEHVQRADSGKPPDESRIKASRLRRSPSRAMSESEVCERAGVTLADLDDLRKHGLVDALNADAVEIAAIVADLSALGLEPRHLRSFRAAADREIGLVEQAMAPHRTAPSARSSIEFLEATDHLLARLLDLHVALVRARSTTLRA